MKKSWLIVAAVILQVAVLAYMAGERELIVRTGETVWLRTAPVDPQDLFRGDYVRLSYDLSTIPRSAWRGQLAQRVEAVERKGWRGRAPLQEEPVYVALKQGESGTMELDFVADERPAHGPFLRGRIESVWGSALRVRYGLEAYFVEQGKGLELERGRSRDGIQVPLEMEVAVGRHGTAVLRGHRWCPLGIGIDLQQERKDNANWLHAATVTLLNASAQPLAIVDLPGLRSLTLDPAGEGWWGSPGNGWRWVGRGSEPPPPLTDAAVKVLQPGEKHAWRVEFKDAAWFVAKPGEAHRSLEQLNEWSARFRLVYRPPPAAACQHLREAERIWHGTLATRAFGAGGID